MHGRWTFSEPFLRPLVPSRPVAALALDRWRGSGQSVLRYRRLDHLAAISESIIEVAAFNHEISGITFQLDVEDAVGVARQVAKRTQTMEEKI